MTSSFVQPFWLAAGLLACCAAALFIVFSTMRRRRILARFASPHLLPLLTANVSQARRRLKGVLFIAGLACLFVALARPQWGSQTVELRQRGIDILIAFDVSKSMLVPDVRPSRLQRAKLAVRDFSAKLDGDRIGLLPFAGSSFLICPLTSDYEAFNASLEALDGNVIPKGGTDIGAAVREAVKVLAGETSHKIMILITDGEELSGNVLEAAELAKQEKMTVYAVGVGTPQGELIPLPGGGPGNFVKDGSGAFVTSKLDEKTLAAVAETTGGMYVPLGTMGQGLDAVHQRKLALIPKEEQGQRKKKVPTERFQWPLAVAVLLFSVDFLLTGRRQPLHLPFIATAGRRWIRRRQAAAAVLAACAFCTAPGRADEGSDLFQAGKYKEAVEYYQHSMAAGSGSPVLHFNLGAALHKQGGYGQAAEEFSKALQTDDLALQAKSYYNRGVSQYAAGRTLESAAVSQAVQQFRQAKQSFAAALKLRPENKQAASSLQTVEQKLAELEKRQQEQQSHGGDESRPQDKKQQQSPQENSGKQQPQPEDPKKQNGMTEKQGGGAGKQQQAEPGGPQKKQDAGPQPQRPDAAPPSAAASGTEQKQAGDAAAAEKQAAQAGSPRQRSGQEREEGSMMTGRMTEEEAQSLLDSLKGEQGELNFMPQEAADSDAVGRDW